MDNDMIRHPGRRHPPTPIRPPESRGRKIPTASRERRVRKVEETREPAGLWLGRGGRVSLPWKGVSGPQNAYQGPTLPRYPLGPPRRSYEPRPACRGRVTRSWGTRRDGIQRPSAPSTMRGVGEGCWQPQGCWGPLGRVPWGRDGGSDSADRPGVPAHDYWLAAPERETPISRPRGDPPWVDERELADLRLGLTRALGDVLGAGRQPRIRSISLRAGGWADLGQTEFLAGPSRICLRDGHNSRNAMIYKRLQRSGQASMST